MWSEACEIVSKRRKKSNVQLSIAGNDFANVNEAKKNIISILYLASAI